MFPFLSVWMLWGALHQAPVMGAVASTVSRTPAIFSSTVDVVLTQSIYPTETVHPGEPFLLNLTFTNTGTTLMNSAVVEDLIPPELIPDSVAPSGISITDISSGQPYRWQTGPLAGGARASILIIGHVDAELSANTRITNTATLTSATDVDPTNNQVQVTRDVQVPTVGFNTTRYAVNEKNVQVPIEVRVTNPNPYAKLTVHYATIDKTAQSQPSELRDFTPISKTLVISEGYPSRQILIPILDDAISEGPEQFNVLLSQPKGAKLGATTQVTLTIIDDDSAGVNISPSSIEVEEAGATAVYSVVLQSQPVAAVNISITADSAVTTSLQELHFDLSNWQTVQTVTVSAIDDRIAEGIQESIIRHTVQSADNNYNDASVADVVATVRDDDAAGLTVTPAELNVAEGAAPGVAAAYSIILKSRPTADVAVQMAPGDQLRTEPDALTFTPATWNTPQNVLVTAIDDAVAEGETTEMVGHALVSQDPHYADAATPDVMVHIADNDTPGVIISQQQITITENADILRATEYYSVSLASQPMQAVTITIAAATAFTVTPSVLHFDADNWQTPQSVAVSVADDNIVSERQSGILMHSVSSPDAHYAALAPSQLTVNVIDNDVAGLNVPSEATLREGGAPLAYQLTLESQPTADVTVTAVISGSRLRITPTTFVFTPDAWDTPQEGSINAVDDKQDDGVQSDQIQFSMASTDPHYDGLQHILDLIILDNDSRRTVYLPLVQKQ
ncbi:MAG: Calx-beta domain-containing protein [Caldilineaceae bacterium]